MEKGNWILTVLHAVVTGLSIMLCKGSESGSYKRLYHQNMYEYRRGRQKENSPNYVEPICIYRHKHLSMH